MDLKKYQINISITVRFREENDLADFINSCIVEGYELMQIIYYKPPSWIFRGKCICLFKNPES